MLEPPLPLAELPQAATARARASTRPAATPVRTIARRRPGDLPPGWGRVRGLESGILMNLLPFSINLVEKQRETVAHGEGAVSRRVSSAPPTPSGPPRPPTGF